MLEIPRAGCHKNDIVILMRLPNSTTTNQDAESRDSSAEVKSVKCHLHALTCSISRLRMIRD